MRNPFFVFVVLFVFAGVFGVLVRARLQRNLLFAILLVYRLKSLEI